MDRWGVFAKNDMTLIQPHILRLSQMVGSPEGQIRRYGGKAQGLVKLLEAQGQAPHPFAIPDTFGIPAHVKDVDDRELRRVYDALTAGAGSRGVLMARSSSLAEMPGRFESLSAAYDLRNPDQGFLRFLNAVQKVRAQSPEDMGVVLMPMVGNVRVTRHGKHSFGETNTSFVADSHSPIHPDEMHIAAVHGLGTRVVAANSDFIPVFVDRATGHILNIGNKDDEQILAYGEEEVIAGRLRNYRQKRLDYFDLKSGSLRSRLIFKDVVDTNHFMLLSGGMLVRDVERTYLWPGIGISPFTNGVSLYQLSRLLGFLSDQYGPVQIEGALTESDSDRIHLYQLLEMPDAKGSDKTITIQKPHMVASEVIGTCDFKGPLLVWHFKGRHEVGGLYRFDKEMSEKYPGGYALITECHHSDIVEATPHCRVRISFGSENISSHAVTMMRTLISQNPDSGYVMAMNPVAQAGIGDRLNQVFKRTGHYLFDFETWVHIQSNGREFALKEIAGEQEQANKKPWWMRLLGF